MQEVDSHKTVTREFAVSSFAVKNKAVVFLLTAMIVLGGLMAYNNMPRENFPEVALPTIYVNTVYPGNSPEDIENLITRPIEKEVNTITGVNKISSTSIQDFSIIVVEFNIKVDKDKALREVKDAVDKAKNDLPNDLDKDPDIFALDFSEFIPIMNINLSGNIKMDYLKEYAEYLQDEIEKLPEISGVDIKGARDREVKVDVDVHKMNAVELSFDDIQNAIAYENLTISGGDILTDGSRRNIRVVGEFKDPAEIGNIIVKNKDQEVVLLKDIADVSFAFEEPKSYARAKDLPVVSLDVKKRTGENLIIAVDKIKEIVDKAKKHKFPENLKITFTNDQSNMTRTNVNHLQNEIISGIILVVLILQLFMGLRNAMFVGIAIPMSMLMSLALLNVFGVTLNSMVLFSLVLALGRLVDDGIVVVENTYRLMQSGLPPVKAAKEGVGEVAMAVIASTITTIIAFVPLLFWNDIMGEFMKYLPITFMIALSSSLLVATVINPTLASIFMKVQDEHEKIKLKPLFISIGILAFFAAVFFALKSHVASNLMVWVIIILVFNNYILSPVSHWFQHHILVRIENAYARLLGFAVRKYNPVFFMVGVVVLLVATFIFLYLRNLNSTFFPVNQPMYANVYIELPIGTDIEKTNELAMQIQKRVYKALEGYENIVDDVITNVGEGTKDPYETGGPSIGVTPHRAKITVSFVDFEKRGGVDTKKVLEKIREEVNVFPGAIITVNKNWMGPPAGKPVSIEVSGDDYDKLANIAEDIKGYVNSYNIPGIEELKLDLEKGKPELLVNVDRTAARRFGLSTGQIAMAIRTALFGKEVSKYKLGEDDYPIMLRFNEKERYDLPALLNQEITFRDMNTGRFVTIPISSVSTVQYTSSYGSINRKDLKRVITIFSNVKEGYYANEINVTIQKILANYEMPEGYTLKFTGEQEQQAKSMAFLMNAFIIALFLVFMVIVAQFKVIHTPLIIMSSVIFSTIGVFLGIALFKMDIVGFMVGLGLIALIGVVVTNAIVLLDCIDFIREKKRAELGLSEEQHLPFNELVNSIVQGGKLRMRPVILTATTAILGLIPLAVGFNFNYATFFDHWNPEIYIGGDNVVFWGPLAWTIIFGLAFATFLTLVIVPVMYLLSDAIGYWVRNKFGNKPAGINS